MKTNIRLSYTTRTPFGASEYHLQWVTKYRYNVLTGEFSWKDCETSIRVAAEMHGIKIIELGAMKDHVHVVAELPPDMAVSHAIGLLKGASSYDMFRKHPEVKRRYWVATSGAEVTSTGQ